ncbi:MAG: glycosyltransferase family 4 protein [Planctomycetota bacterium]|jgi:glycosyltransferase involved in cell wall biosynthesis
MEVLFLTIKKDGRSARWRINQLLPHLEKHDIHGTVLEMPVKGAFARLSTVKKAVGYDAVVLLNRLLPRLLTYRLRKNAKRMIFEIDEAVTVKKEGVGRSVTRERRLKRTLRIVDAVIASSEHFADLARGVTSAPDIVHVIPTTVDLKLWGTRDRPHKGPAGVIGWLGAPAGLTELSVVAQPLLRLCRRYEDLKVRVVCGKALELDGLPLEHKIFDPTTVKQEVRGFDIAIVPRIENAITRGMTPTDLLASFASGIPVVASNVPAIRRFIRHGENGFLCGTLSEWEETLEKLVDDPELRARIGAAGRETLESGHRLRDVVPQYVEFFEKIREGEPAPAVRS